jgi:hypothetical protein
MSEEGPRYNTGELACIGDRIVWHPSDRAVVIEVIREGRPEGQFASIEGGGILFLLRGGTLVALEQQDEDVYFFARAGSLEAPSRWLDPVHVDDTPQPDRAYYADGSPVSVGDYVFVGSDKLEGGVRHISSHCVPIVGGRDYCVASFAVITELGELLVFESGDKSVQLVHSATAKYRPGGWYGCG